MRTRSLVAFLLPIGLLVACGDKEPAAGGNEDTGPTDFPDEDTSSEAVDADGDGWDAALDCNDDDALVYPGAPEDCNGVDDDCNGVVDDGFPDTDTDGTPDCLDAEECDGLDNDGDGLVDEDWGDSDEDGIVDCLDAEECDGLDNDGNGEIDEGFDADGDGYLACGPDALDCDDDDADVNPDATEVPGDGIDNDCNGVADDERWDTATLIITEIMNNPGAVSDIYGEWFELYNPGEDTVDIDGLTITSSAGGESHIIDNGGPLEIEAGGYLVLGINGNSSTNGGIPVDYVYSGIRLDNEADDIVVAAGADIIDEVVWDDGDAFPDPDNASMELDIYGIDGELNDVGEYWCTSIAEGPGVDACTPGEEGGLCPTVDRDRDGYAPDEGDCDDADPTVYPGAVAEATGGECMWDGDGDGFGDTDATGIYDPGTDCDDADPTAYPGVASVEDELCTHDADGDGYGDLDAVAPLEAGTDCDDADSAINPVATELWYDGVDQDCAEDNDYDADADGFELDTYGGTDCDDTDATINTDGEEVCDGVDNDCDTLVDDDDSDTTDASYSWLDLDGDGYGDMTDTPVLSCSGAVTGSGYADNPSDCDDDDASVSPDATETAYDGVDDDCDGADLEDVDGDGVAADTVGGDDCDDNDAHVFPGQWEDTSDGVDNDCDGDIDTADTDSPTLLSLSDDSSTTITPSSFSFDFCGTSYSSANVISNGRILFTSSTTSYSESASTMASTVGVAVLWDDLNPRSCGSVYWHEESDHVSVFYRGVCEYGTSGDTVTATAVFHDDGTVTLDYESVVNITDGLVGVSCGDGTLDTAYDLSDAEWTDNAAGLGSGTENIAYQYWSSGNDISGSTIKFCMQSGSDSDGDGWTDECGDQDDTDAQIYPR